MENELVGASSAVQEWCTTHQRGIKDIPTELQQRVVKLLETHRWATVCGAVGVDKNRLCGWRRAHRDVVQLKPRVSRRKKALVSTAPAFIELPAPRTSEPVAESGVGFEIELAFPGGAVLRGRSPGESESVARLFMHAVDTLATSK